MRLRCQLIHEAITHPCANNVTRNNLQCLCCAPLKMGGWSILYDNLSEACFAHLLSLDKSLVAIREAKSCDVSDNEDSIYSWFSHIWACIIGNDSVCFSCEGRLMSNEEAGVKSYLGVDKANIWSGESIYSHYKILKLTPAQQSWVKEHCGLTAGQCLRPISPCL